MKKEIEWITPAQAAEKWGIAERQVQAKCAKGKINGAVRFGRVWLIPRDAKRPIDGRTKASKTDKGEALKR